MARVTRACTARVLFMLSMGMWFHNSHRKFSDHVIGQQIWEMVVMMMKMVVMMVVVLLITSSQLPGTMQTK